jgi:SAM-dependent methyltransferase
VQACEICGTDETVTIAVVDSFNVDRCKHCGLVYVTNPVDESDLAKLYSEQYYLDLGSAEYSPRSGDPNLKRLYNFNKQRLDAIERLMAPGDLLDVGCGPGFFMLSARARGWRVKGVDISARAVGFAGAGYGLEVTEGQLETASFSDQSFDLITAWQLLEHTSKPLATLKHARKLLRPDGLLVVEVPNLNSLAGRLKGKRFSASAHPRFHRYYFTHPSIHNLLKRAGFDGITRLDCRYRDGAGFRSGAKSLTKQALRSIGVDSFVTIAARR